MSIEKPCNIIVEAVGANSFNAITTSGFFRVIHRGGLPIQKVEFDWMACRDSLQTTMYFDCDNPTMADSFWFGNSTQVGATGTYRNNSDKTTGLIYDKLNTPVGPGASTGANTGWIGSNASNNGTPAYNFKTVTFRFGLITFQGNKAKPEVFEVDIDTDGGVGLNGASMAGMVVRVTVLGGRTFAGELVADTSSTTSRSVTGF